MSKVSIIPNNRSRQVRRCYCKKVRNRKGEGIHVGVGVGVVLQMFIIHKLELLGAPAPIVLVSSLSD